MIRKQRTIRTSLLCATAAIASLVGTGANAQNGEIVSPADGEIGNPDLAQANSTSSPIIVTAQRREQRLQDVPISVGVFGGEQLEQRNVVNVLDLSVSVPGFTAVQSFSQADLKIGLRGISELIPALSVDPAVGVYIDGVYYQLHSNANVAMVDMERVEVLYGPQGTLFGRNTIGGALNITTRRPTDEFEGSLLIGGGNYSSRRATGVLNIPLSSDAAFRVVYDHNEHSGYGRNTFLDTPLNSANHDYLRVSGRFDISDSTELFLSGFYQKSVFTPTPIRLAVDETSPIDAVIPALQGNPGDLLSNYEDTGFYDSQGYNHGNLPLEIYGFTGILTHEIGSVTFKSISSFSQTRYAPLSVSGTPYQFLEIPSFPLNVSQWSQELQLFGDLDDGRLEWVGGLYYFGEDGFERNQLVNIPPLGTPLGFDRRDGPEVNNHSYAAYLQATYAITQKLSLTAGIRYTRDTRDTTYHSAIEDIPTRTFVRCTLGIIPTPTTPEDCQITYRGRYDYLPWTLGIDYHPSSDLLLYAKVSQGYRSGAASSSGPSAANIAVFDLVDPESLLSPEIGGKVTLFDGRLQLSAAAFFSRYENIQQNQVQTAPTGQVSVLRNVGTGEIWGGEFSAIARIEDLNLSFSLAVVDPTYVDGPSVGSPFLNTAKYSWSIAGEYPIETGAGTLRIGADYGWQSRQWFFPPVPGNAEQNEAVSQGSYGLLNGHVAFDLANAPITVNLWARNILGTHYQVAALDLVPAGLGATLVFNGQPSTYGITASWRFGGSN